MVIFYHYCIIRSSPKKFCFNILLTSILSFIIVRSSVLFVEENTHYSIWFPVLFMQIGTLFQYTWLYMLYRKEVFSDDIFYLDRWMANKKCAHIYNIKEKQLFIFYLWGSCIELFIWILGGNQKQVFPMLFLINFVGICLAEAVYIEGRFQYICEIMPVWKKIMDGIVLILFVILFYHIDIKIFLIWSASIIIRTQFEKIYLWRYAK